MRQTQLGLAEGSYLSIYVMKTFFFFFVPLRVNMYVGWLLFSISREQFRMKFNLLLLHYELLVRVGTCFVANMSCFQPCLFIGNGCRFLCNLSPVAVSFKGSENVPSVVYY